MTLEGGRSPELLLAEVEATVKFTPSGEPSCVGVPETNWMKPDALNLK